MLGACGPSLSSKGHFAHGGIPPRSSELLRRAGARDAVEPELEGGLELLRRTLTTLAVPQQEHERILAGVRSGASAATEVGNRLRPPEQKPAPIATDPILRQTEANVLPEAWVASALAHPDPDIGKPHPPGKA